MDSNDKLVAIGIGALLLLLMTLIAMDVAGTHQKAQLAIELAKIQAGCKP